MIVAPVRGYMYPYRIHQMTRRSAIHNIRRMRRSLYMAQNGVTVPLLCRAKLLPLDQCGISLKLKCFSIV